MPSTKRKRVDSPMEYQNTLAAVPKPTGPLQSTSPERPLQNDYIVQHGPIHHVPQTEKDCQKLGEWVETLDESTVRRLLKDAATLHSDMYTSVWIEKRMVELAETNARRRLMMEEQAKVLDFSKQIQGVSHTINRKYNGLRASKQYEMAQEAEGDIGSIVAHGGGCVGEEVRKSIGQYSDFMDNLWKIIKNMNDSDKEYVRRREDLMKTLERFDNDSQGFDIFQGSEKVVSCFKRAAGDLVDSDDDDDYDGNASGSEDNTIENL
ncbi:hypothetical protein D6C95_08091 [Aureobasidium pullulans]|nr:hypothetical protein D6C95_08091 [Aureobasidium pullulans]